MISTKLGSNCRNVLFTFKLYIAPCPSHEHMLQGNPEIVDCLQEDYVKSYGKGHFLTKLRLYHVGTFEIKSKQFFFK